MKPGSSLTFLVRRLVDKFKQLAGVPIRVGSESSWYPGCAEYFEFNIDYTVGASYDINECIGNAERIVPLKGQIRSILHIWFLGKGLSTWPSLELLFIAGPIIGANLINLQTPTLNFDHASNILSHHKIFNTWWSYPSYRTGLDVRTAYFIPSHSGVINIRPSNTINFAIINKTAGLTFSSSNQLRLTIGASLWPWSPVTTM